MWILTENELKNYRNFGKYIWKFIFLNKMAVWNIKGQLITHFGSGFILTIYILMLFEKSTITDKLILHDIA